MEAAIQIRNCEGGIYRPAVATAPSLCSHKLVMPFKISIITSSKEGADRAALDWSLENGMPHGGWCPLGTLTGVVPLDEKYRLKETETEAVLESVDCNVRDSDATLIITIGPKATGPAQKASTYSKKQKKPVLHVHRAVLGAAERVVEFIDKHYIRRLHVTGANETEEPGISNWVKMTLDRVKSTIDRRPD